MKNPKLSSQLETLKLDSQLCFALYSSSRLLIQAYQPLLEELDLTYTQYLVLLALIEGTPLSMKQLGRRLFLDSGTLSPLVKKMEAKKLIRRSEDPEDERGLIISLTTTGENLCTRLPDVTAAIGKKLTRDFTVTELKGLRASLQKLTQSLLN